MSNFNCNPEPSGAAEGSTELKRDQFTDDHRASFLKYLSMLPKAEYDNIKEMLAGHRLSEDETAQKAFCLGVIYTLDRLMEPQNMLYFTKTMVKRQLMEMRKEAVKSNPEYN